MKFKGTPGMLVHDTKPRRRHRKNYRFDNDGFLEVDDRYKDLCIRLATKFEVVEVKDDAEKETEKTEEAKVLKCKKCEYETTNKGELMAHYRKVHPKKKGDK